MFVFQRTILTLLLVMLVPSLGCQRLKSYWQKDPLVFSGTVETREIRVGSKVGGRVTEVLVQEGKDVAGGTPLVRIDVSEVAEQIKQSEARIGQQKARLEALEIGSRPEEKAQAREAVAVAKAQLDAVRNWPRPEEVAQARATLAAAEADVADAQTTLERNQRLAETGDVPKSELDSAKFGFERAAERRNTQKKALELLLNGSRPEDVRAAEHKYQQAVEAERLVLKGPRPQEIEDSRMQLREAEARLAQLKVQLEEGEIRAPSAARVEVVSVRPGDVVTPNQPLAKLLEQNQLWVRIYIPEPQLGLIKVGDRVKVKIDTFPNREFAGVVEQINSQGEFTPRNIQSRNERNHQVFGVKVNVENKDGVIKSGMAADVSFPGK